LPNNVGGDIPSTCVYVHSATIWACDLHIGGGECSELPPQRRFLSKKESNTLTLMHKLATCHIASKIACQRRSKRHPCAPELSPQRRFLTSQKRKACTLTILHKLATCHIASMIACQRWSERRTSSMRTRASSATTRLRIRRGTQHAHSNAQARDMLHRIHDSLSKKVNASSMRARASSATTLLIIKTGKQHAHSNAHGFVAQMNA
jgi:hypothetical protein